MLSDVPLRHAIREAAAGRQVSVGLAEKIWNSEIEGIRDLKILNTNVKTRNS
jgi:hypothetical protein